MLKVLLLVLLSVVLNAQSYLTKEEKKWIENNPNVTIAMLNNFKPFTYVQNNLHIGFSVELLKLIEEKSGLNFSIQTSKWSEALNKFKNKKVDMISEISHTKQREDFTLFSTAYYEIPTYIFGIQNSNYDDNSSLIGKKVGVSKNIFYIKDLEEKGIDVIELSSSIEKVNKLVTGEIDYFTASYTSGINAITKQSVTTVKPLDELSSIKKEDLRFGINKDKPLLHSIINKTLQQIKADKLEHLKTKWILQNMTSISAQIEFTKEELNYIREGNIIKVGSIDTYTPFSFTEHNEKKGFTQDLLQIISENSGLIFEKVGGTWPEVFGSFKNGSIDIITEFSFRPERLNFSLYTQPYYEIPIGVFTRKDFGTYEGIGSLKGKKVGIVKGSYLNSIIRKIPDIKLVEIESTDKRFYALENKKVDAVLSNSMSLFRVKEALLLKEIKLAGYFEHPEAKTEDLRFGIRKEQPILASIMEKTLNSIDYAKLTQLKNKWIYQNTSNETNAVYLNNKEKAYITNNPVIKVSNEMDWPPFDFVKDNMPAGYSIDLIKLITSKVGLTPKFVNGYSWLELVEKFKNNELDILHSLTKNTQRESYGIFSKPYMRYQTHFIVKENAPFIQSIEDAQEMTFVVGKGWSTADFFKKYYPNIKLIEVQNVQEILETISKNENHIALMNKKVAQYMIKKLNLIDLEIAGWCQEFDKEKSKMLHFMAHKQNSELISIFNKALDALTMTEIENLNKKWFGSNSNLAYEQITLLEKKFLEQNPTIRFKVNPNNPPFEFKQNGKAVGIAVDYIKLASENIGINPQFVFDGAYDTKLFEQKKPSLINKLSFGITFLSYPNMIITNKDTEYISSLTDLENKTVVLEKDSPLNKYLSKDFQKINVINTTNSTKALQMVNDNKVDAFVGNWAIANYMNAFGKMDNLKIVAPTDYENIKLHFVAPKVWPELASLLSKGFEQITQTQHTSIQQKWFSFKVIEKVDYSLLWKILAVVLFIIAFFIWWNRTLRIEKNKTKDALHSLQNSQKSLQEKNDQLAQSKLLLESVINESPNPIMIKNSSDQFVLVNKLFADLYNTSEENMLGKDDSYYTDISPLAQLMIKDIQAMIDAKEKNIKNLFEDVNVTIDGEKKHYMIIKKRFTNHKNEILVLVVANDITMIKELENEKLQQQQLIFNQAKIASMGEMVANIAHQWRQPLSVISTVSTGSKLQKEMDALSDEEFEENMDIINSNAQYLSSTIDTFRNFIKEEKIYKEVVLQDRINITLDIYGTALKNHQIELINNIDYEHPIKIHLVVGELSQVLGNIISNAKDILLEKKIANAWIKLDLVQTNKSVTITIEDNAGGIPEEIMPRIFEPYFTTKHSSQGTGLGLHMSYKIITESFNGKLYAKNTTDGAKFFIELPLK